MKKAEIVGIVSLLVLMLLMSCAPQAAPAPQPPAPAAAPAPARAAPAPVVAPTRPAWQEEWERLLTVAKQEGKVVIRTSAVPLERQALINVAKKEGLDAEVVSGRPADILPRVTAERRAGLYLNDIYIEGPLPLINSAKPAGVLESMNSVFVLPDFTDAQIVKKLFYAGVFPWADQDNTIIIMSLQPQIPYAINTNLVKPEEVKSFRDLLNPKWKGKLVVVDPTVAGAAQNSFMAVDTIMGTDYLKEIAKTEPQVIRDERLMMDWLAHGKIAMALFTRTASLPEFIDLGAPIKGITPSEGSYVAAGVAGVSWFNKPAHPNAAKAFLNFLMTKEGQDIWSPGGGYHSVRLDASTAHLRPDQMRQEGVNYVDGYTEKAAARRKVTDPLAKEIFGPLVK